jgi:hypothetical protein
MTKQVLVERVMPEIARVNILESADAGKPLLLKGIAIQGDVQNRNGRVYPKGEIENAVKELKERISRDGPVAGECDHPDNLGLALDRISHLIEDIWMDGPDGHAKFKVMPFGLGEIITGLVKHGMKIGVSSRGSGNVDGQGRVSDFEIVTIDIVANPSAPNAYPKPILESLQGSPSGRTVTNLAEAIRQDPKAQKYFSNAVLDFLKKELSS